MSSYPCSHTTTKAEPHHKMLKYCGDYIGQRFGKLVVVAYPATQYGERRAGAICECDCGNYEFVDSCAKLFNGETTMCAKCRNKVLRERINKRLEPKRMADPLSAYKRERLYLVWQGMIKRCESEQSPSYVDYGANGVTVCPEWHDYLKFREWAHANGFREEAKGTECSIDRINPFGNYEPSNCRWVDFETQQRNKRKDWLREHGSAVS
ncbi:MAG TPA: hypothetical protein DCP91_02725 [Eggerthellaceae bacterium]|nr:hypothetical protein [Eggerthellaceae bacterium]